MSPAQFLANTNTWCLSPLEFNLVALRHLGTHCLRVLNELFKYIARQTFPFAHRLPLNLLLLLHGSAYIDTLIGKGRVKPRAIPASGYDASANGLLQQGQWRSSPLTNAVKADGCGKGILPVEWGHGPYTGVAAVARSPAPASTLGLLVFAKVVSP